MRRRVERRAPPGTRTARVRRHSRNKHDRRVEQEPRPRRHVRDRPADPGTDPTTGRLGARRQPDVHRLRVQQPVGGRLGQPGVDVDHRHLKTQQVRAPGRQRRRADRRAQQRIQRGGAMRGDEHQQRREQADQVVVIEVGRDVDQLQVREREEQQRHRRAVDTAPARPAAPARRSRRTAPWSPPVTAAAPSRNPSSAGGSRACCRARRSSRTTGTAATRSRTIAPERDRGTRRARRCRAARASAAPQPLPATGAAGVSHCRSG